ncbi:MAG TPA: beta-eliminating lyase-related protein [Candidatus Saccharimonadales bacterium]
MKPVRTFASDNHSAVHPHILDYLQKINEQGHAPSYTGDPVTIKAQSLFRDIFGKGAQVVFVPSGTGANILALKVLLQQPYEALVCTNVSHVFEEETGAVSASIGRHIFTLPHIAGKISLDDLQAEVAFRRSLGFHSPLPKVVSIACTTEYGTFYTLQEIRAIADFCHKNDLYLHLDGCRLPNAIAALGCSLQEYTSSAGVDVLSFGGAKNGLMSAEAVVVFNAPKTDLLRMQKQAMQLVSKMRYVSGQFVPYLERDLWLRNARHANELAKRLGDGLKTKLGSAVSFTQPVATNQVFCILPPTIKTKLRSAGHEFYDWNSPGEVRFVTSWDNTDEDVDGLLSLVNIGQS